MLFLEWAIWFTNNYSVSICCAAEVHKVSLQSGFSEQQALETLAKWTGKSVDTLPPEAQAIYKASKG